MEQEPGETVGHSPSSGGVATTNYFRNGRAPTSGHLIYGSTVNWCRQMARLGQREPIPLAGKKPRGGAVRKSDAWKLAAPPRTSPR